MLVREKDDMSRLLTNDADEAQAKDTESKAMG